MSDAKPRCDWPANDTLMIAYHDNEWGVPVHNDKLHFEFLILDAFQAGLSWRTILYKRENFREAFDGFDVERVARYGKRDVNRLLKNEGIIRNRLKVATSITNAQAFIDIQNEYGSFDEFVWNFVGGETIQNAWVSMKHLPAKTKESDAMSEELKERGMKFVGSTILYAYMQAAGMVNDHEVGCYRHAELNGSVSK